MVIDKTKGFGGGGGRGWRVCVGGLGFFVHDSVHRCLFCEKFGTVSTFFQVLRGRGIPDLLAVP